MSIFATLWIFWTCYLGFRVSFNTNYIKQQHGAIWTLRAVGFMGLLMALDDFLYYFEIIDLPSFYEEFESSIFLIAIAILCLFLYKDICLLKKAGQKFSDIFKEKSPSFMLFTWDMWVVTIISFVAVYILKYT